jgi:hypothetical protein
MKYLFLLSLMPPAKRAAFYMLLFLLPAFISGCDIYVFNEKKIPGDADRFAREYVQTLRSGEVELAQGSLNETLQTPEVLASLLKISEDIGPGELISLRLVKYGHSKDLFIDETQTRLVYEMHLDTGWHIVQAVVYGLDGVYKITAFYVEPKAESRIERNVFTLAGKSIRQYVVLFLAAAVPLFIIYTAYLCIRSPMRHRWLWLTFILFGFSSYSVDWTSGLWGFKLFSFSILGASISRSGLDGPWILAFHIPIGAIIFYIRHRRIGKTRHAEAFGPPVDRPPPPPSPPTPPSPASAPPVPRPPAR